MKIIASLAAVTFLVSKLMGMDDGLYDISNMVHPQLIDNQVGEVTISSQLNDNSQYHLEIRALHAFSPSMGNFELVISNETVRFNSYGSDNAGKITSLGKEIKNPKIVSLIAEHYHINTFNRHHPGYEMMTEFIPEKEEFTRGESVMVKLRISNVGNTVFAFMEGGRQRGWRDNQFAFSAEQRGQKMLPDIGSPENFGGLESRVILNPGTSKEIEVDLTKWFKFPENGTYSVRGSYYMEFVQPNAMDFQTIWTDYACAEFAVTIK